MIRSAVLVLVFASLAHAADSNFALTIYSTADPATFDPQQLAQQKLANPYNAWQMKLMQAPMMAPYPRIRRRNSAGCARLMKSEIPMPIETEMIVSRRTFWGLTFGREDAPDVSSSMASLRALRPGGPALSEPLS